MVSSISWDGTEEPPGFRPEEKWVAGEGFTCEGNGLVAGMSNGAQEESTVPCGGLFPYFHQSAEWEICLHLDPGHKFNKRGQVSLPNKREHGTRGGSFIF